MGAPGRQGRFLLARKRPHRALASSLHRGSSLSLASLPRPGSSPSASLPPASSFPVGLAQAVLA